MKNHMRKPLNFLKARPTLHVVVGDGSTRGRPCTWLWEMVARAADLARGCGRWSRCTEAHYLSRPTSTDVSLNSPPSCLFCSHVRFRFTVRTACTCACLPLMARLNKHAGNSPAFDDVCMPACRRRTRPKHSWADTAQTLLVRRAFSNARRCEFVRAR